MTHKTTHSDLSGQAMQGLTEYLSIQYPDIQDLKVLDLHKFGDGWETDLYRLDLSGIDGAHLELVLRLYGGNDAIDKAQKEYSLMKGVLQFGIAAPQVDALVTDLSIFGQPFLVMEYIPGGTLETYIERDGAQRWIAPMMETLAQIHSIPWTALISKPQSVLPSPDEPEAFVRSVLGEMDRSIAQYELSGFEPTMDWLRERESLGKATKPSLIHNDYHPLNILLRGDELLVIDWSFAEISDGRLDLAWTVMLLTILAGNEHRSAILGAYEHAIGTPVENFEYFEALKLSLRMMTIATWFKDDVEIPIPRITKQALRSDYRVHLLNPYRRLKEVTGIEIPLIEDL